MPNFILIIKRWVAILVARRFLVKQGYTRAQAKKVAKDLVSIKMPEIEVNNVLDYFKSANKKQ